MGKLHLFPNPATDQIQVAYSGAKRGRMKLSLMQLDGRMVREVHLPQVPPSGQVEVSVQGVSPGAYLIRLQAGPDQIEKLLGIH